MSTNPKQEQARHKAHLYRLLVEVLDDELSQNAYFKGGTCAKMLGWLDRFSVDLDFDLNPSADKKELRKRLHNIFTDLDLELKDESRQALQFFLKYDSPPNQRNTIKLELIDNTVSANEYEAKHLKDIDRSAICQTIETMFANKLVAVMDRFEQNDSIAGRDIYDIHHFFMQGYDYNPEVIEERRGIKPLEYLENLAEFIEEKVDQKIINQDLNMLLPYDKFKRIRKTLKQETLRFMREEV